jgi:hypothetical protein
LLAPDLVDAILSGQTDQMLMLGKLERPLSANGRSSESGSARESMGNRSSTGSLSEPPGSEPAAASNTQPAIARSIQLNAAVAEPNAFRAASGGPT